MRVAWPIWMRRLIPEYAAYLSFTSGPALRELEEVYGAKRAVGFFCSVDPELYRRTTARAEFACNLSYLGTYAVDRQAKLMGLLNGAALSGCRRVRVFWWRDRSIRRMKRWAANVRRLDHVGPADHPAFYSSSRFTLNLTRADMVAAGYSPSVSDCLRLRLAGLAFCPMHGRGWKSFLRRARRFCCRGMLLRWWRF